MQSKLKSPAAKLDCQIQMLVAHLRKDPEQRPEGMSAAQIFLLRILSFKGPLRITALAELLGVTPGAVTGLADSLLNLGLIKRERCQNDRRVVYLSLAEAAKDLLRDLEQKRHQRLAKALQGLEGDEPQLLINLLEKLAEQLEIKADCSG